MARYQGKFLNPENDPAVQTHKHEDPQTVSPEIQIPVVSENAQAQRPVRRHDHPSRKVSHVQHERKKEEISVANATGLEAKMAARHHAKTASKKREAWLFEQLWLLLFLLASAAIPEMVLHAATADGWSAFFNSGLILPILFAAVPALLFYGLICLISNKTATRIITVAYSIFWLVFCGSQLVYYSIFGCFYSAYSMANGGAAFQFVATIFTSLLKNILIIVLMAVPALFSIFFWRRVIPRRCKWRKATAAVPAVAAIVLQLVLILILPIFGGTEAMSAYDLYHKNSDSYFSVNKLGLGTAFRLDATRLLLGNSADGDIELDVPDDTAPHDSTPAGDSTTVNNAGGTTDAEGTESQGTTAPTLDTSPNVLQFDFDALIADASNDKVKAVHQYFQKRSPSNKNEKTGMFEGCNLILITAEAFSHLAVTEERTPTLYKLMHEGFYFTDYYVPNWGVSTTDGEYAFLTGTVPKAGVWSFSKSSDNAMPLTMCAKLLDEGYSAYAYHGHTYSYYDRNQYLENLGYVYRAYGQGLDVKKTWPESDVEVVDKTTADYVSKEPFTAYYMTISGHREFTFSGNYIASKNKSLVADEPYSNNVRAYLATQLELEASMKLLLERLEAAGVLENTVIVLTADHYPNGLTVEEMSELAGHDIDTDFEIYRNGCIIYKAGMTPETIDEPCSHLDLLPTLSNLFGVEFDSRLYMGRDIFSDAEPFVMFRNRNWITDQAWYINSSGKVINKTDAPVNEAYIKKMSQELNNRFTVSARILEYNYWKILYPYY